MSGLEGKRIGIAADRRADIISKMIRKKGGIPIVYPLQGMQKLNEKTNIQNVNDFLEKSFDWTILTTGIGASTLADAAIKAGVHVSFIDKLNRTRLAVRGKKTLQWLKENSLEADRISSDGTMENLLADFSSYQQNHGQVFLQAYNQDDARLKQHLEKAGYSVYLSQPYSYEKPLPQVVSSLKCDIADLYLDAVVFTSKTQVKNLFNDPDLAEVLIKAFDKQVLPVAVGKVTAGELADQGITDILQPDDPKMGAMVVAIDLYYQQWNS